MHGFQSFRQVNMRQTRGRDPPMQNFDLCDLCGRALVCPPSASYVASSSPLGVAVGHRYDTGPAAEP